MMLDLQLVQMTQQAFFASSWGVGIAIFLARWLIFAYLPIGLWLLWSRKRREKHAVLEAAWSVGVALLFRSVLSALIDRPRPFLASPDVTLLISPPLHTSFPSGHAATAFAMCAALFFVNRRIGLAALAIAVLIAIGRVAVGVHYPTDVLGGAVVGIASFVIVWRIHRELRKRA